MNHQCTSIKSGFISSSNGSLITVQNVLSVECISPIPMTLRDNSDSTMNRKVMFFLLCFDVNVLWMEILWFRLVYKQYFVSVVIVCNVLLSIMAT